MTGYEQYIVVSLKNMLEWTQPEISVKEFAFDKTTNNIYENNGHKSQKKREFMLFTLSKFENFHRQLNLWKFFHFSSWINE